MQTVVEFQIVVRKIQINLFKGYFDNFNIFLKKLDAEFSKIVNIFKIKIENAIDKILFDKKIIVLVLS